MVNLLDAGSLLSAYGWVGILIVMFAETGLLIGFFLPGDTLLFTAGLLCTSAGATAHTKLSLPLVLFAAIFGALAGAQTGFVIGRKGGRPLLNRSKSKHLHKGVVRAEEFLERYGHGKAIVIARFVPVVRTVMNPMAGIVGVPARTFAIWQVAGGTAWSGGLVVAGYALGNSIPNVDKYLLPIVALILVISVIPIGLELLRSRRAAKTTPQPNAENPSNPHTPAQPYAAATPGRPYGASAPEAGPRAAQPGRPYGATGPREPYGVGAPGQPYGAGGPGGYPGSAQPGQPYGAGIPVDRPGAVGPQPYGATGPREPYGAGAPGRSQGADTPGAAGTARPGEPYGARTPDGPGVPDRPYGAGAQAGQAYGGPAYGGAAQGPAGARDAVRPAGGQEAGGQFMAAPGEEDRRAPGVARGYGWYAEDETPERFGGSGETAAGTPGQFAPWQPEAGEEPPAR